jgi:hypothetical protein
MGQVETKVRCKIGMLISWMCAITHSMRVITHIVLGETHEEEIKRLGQPGTTSSAGFVALSIVEGS